jgi:tetratricopeptide (TPR) repeat protein
MESYESAEKDFKTALELNPKSHIAWANLGFIYRNTTGHLKALDCFDKAIAIKKDYVDAYINRAKLYFELDKAQSACSDLNYANSLFRTKSQSLEIDQLIKEYNCISLESRIESQESRTKNPAWPAGKSQELRTKN